MISLILLVFAFVFAVIAAFAPVAEPWPWKIQWRLLCFSLACYFLAEILRPFFPPFHG